jgi:hypothetical protein
MRCGHADRKIETEKNTTALSLNKSVDKRRFTALAPEPGGDPVSESSVLWDESAENVDRAWSDPGTTTPPVRLILG